MKTRQSSTIFRDMTMLALAGFVFLVILMLPWINPAALKKSGDIHSPGAVMVELFWPDKDKSDVDLWVQAPGDVPVGYSDKSGHIFNLLRDDLGSWNDITDLNYETSFTRGIPAGEYVVNAMLYRLEDAPPIPVRAVVSVRQGDGMMRQILYADGKLVHLGEEITLLRFSLDDTGHLEPGSVNNIFKPLRQKR